MRKGFIQCRTPRDIDDDGQYVPAGEWDSLSAEPVPVEDWQWFLAECGDMTRQGSTDIYTDASGLEYRFMELIL